MNWIFNLSDYMPHGMCLLWQPWLVLLWAGSDLLIFLSYSAIPLGLILFLRKRPGFGFDGLVALFAAFILLCGITHLLSVVSLWVPAYPLFALVKLATGLVSALTAIVLIRLVPVVAALPSPRELEDANARLRDEIAAHERTLAELREVQAGLERTVAERTAELSASNERLRDLTHEAVHRTKNLLTVVQSLARQTERTALDKESFIKRFFGRLKALSNATDAVLAGSGSDDADMRELLLTQLASLIDAHPGRITLAGPAQRLRAEAAQQLALGAYELATNAAKYGALSSERGRVDVCWSIEGETPGEQSFHFVWRESGGRGMAPDAEDGFGTTLLTRAVPMHLHGEAARDFTADGMVYTLTAPLSQLVRGAASADPTTIAFPVSSLAEA